MNSSLVLHEMQLSIEWIRNAFKKLYELNSLCCHLTFTNKTAGIEEQWTKNSDAFHLSYYGTM